MNHACRDEATVQKFFQSCEFPTTNGVRIDYLIVKAGIEMRHLNLKASTPGCYVFVVSLPYSLSSIGIDDVRCITRPIGLYDLTGLMVQMHSRFGTDDKIPLILLELGQLVCYLVSIHALVTVLKS